MNFLELVRRRRSVRKFETRPIEAEKIAELRALAARAKEVFGAAGAELIIEADPLKSDELRRAIVSGWKGKINAWIYTTTFPATLVLLARVESDGGDDAHTRNLPGASMLLQTIVLAAAEMGLGTTWMAGFNAAAVGSCLGLTDQWRPVICSPLGYPTEKGRLEMLSRTIAQSDRRKPLAEIHELRGNF